MKRKFIVEVEVRTSMSDKRLAEYLQRHINSHEFTVKPYRKSSNICPVKSGGCCLYYRDMGKKGRGK